MYNFQDYSFSESKLSERSDSIRQDALKDEQNVLKQILGLIDLTTLNGDDTVQKVLSLCETGKSFADASRGIPNVAAICVYPVFAEAVRDALKGSEIKTACVAGAFPSGQSPLSLRIDEVRYAIDHGAEEIDMVISRGRLIEGDAEYVSKEVELFKKACGDVHLKVILETGELKSPELIRKAAGLAINAGADFLKTSTGKIEPAATPEAFLVMLDTIREYFQATGKMVGVKAAGGIAEPAEAIHYFKMVRRVLGDRWLHPSYFRIGASRLAGNVHRHLLEST